VSEALEALDPWGYGVATLEEGAELRDAGIARPILVFLPGRPDLFDAVREHQLTPALGDAPTIRAWCARGEQAGSFHLEIDTGMGRSGVRWDEIDALAGALDVPQFEGCFTQFHSADRQDGTTELQCARFVESVARLPRVSDSRMLSSTTTSGPSVSNSQVSPSGSSITTAWPSAPWWTRTFG